MNFLDARRVHVIGIGGIGTSGLAKILAHRGVMVSGSDADASVVTDEVRAAHISVSIGHAAENITADIEAIVYSGAVPTDNVERLAADERGIPSFSYSEALGELTKQYRTIAVSGTHGKSTTTAMLACILRAAGLDPLVLVGTRVPNFEQGNVFLGRGEIFVVEACEHEAQMMNLHPEKIIITNLEPDHLDFYGTYAAYQETFHQYVSRIAPENCVVNFDNLDARALFSADPLRRTHLFGLQGGELRCVGRRSADGVQYAALTGDVELKLRIPGAFNVMNAMAAILMAEQCGVERAFAARALFEYPGSWRRFERVGQVNGAEVISDYGHHPTAINETLKATREFFPRKRVVLVYQPHQHHRTKALYAEFIDALVEPDALILNEVYHVRGREHADDASATSANLMQEVSARRGAEKQHWYAATLDEVASLVKQHAKSDDVVVIMGAGDIYKISKDLCST